MGIGFLQQNKKEFMSKWRYFHFSLYRTIQNILCGKTFAWTWIVLSVPKLQKRKLFACLLLSVASKIIIHLSKNLVNIVYWMSMCLTKNLKFPSHEILQINSDLSKREKSCGYKITN